SPTGGRSARFFRACDGCPTPLAICREPATHPDREEEPSVRLQRPKGAQARNADAEQDEQRRAEATRRDKARSAECPPWRARRGARPRGEVAPAEPLGDERERRPDGGPHDEPD